MKGDSRKILVICDSHGTKWGANGYGELLNENFDECEVTLLRFGGISLEKIYKSLVDKKFESYDFVILGVGNPDVHPRFPIRFKKAALKLGVLVKESYFCIPPFFCFTYFARIPTFILKLVLIRFWKESYLEKEEVVFYFSKIHELFRNKCTKVIILPLFYVSNIYGGYHNDNVFYVNRVLKKNFRDDFLEGKVFEGSYYRRFYNKDFFHFTQSYQYDIYESIKERMLQHKR
tara:strand:+ start:2302 stop:2997 length:696 start_codon:yes stop_codon:yes gene_type:complete